MIEKTILGIDIEAIMPLQEILSKKKFQNQMSFWKRCLNLLMRQNCIVYFLVPDRGTRKNNESLNNALIKYSQSPLVTVNKIINYKNDYYGAVREYRIDILILPEAKLTDMNNYTIDDVTINLADRKKGKNRSGYYITDFLPDYT